jgi:hypothetical protein
VSTRVVDSFELKEHFVFSFEGKMVSVALLIGFWFISAVETAGIKIGGVMADETAEERLARLEFENKRLREQVEQRRTGELRLKVSEKGGLSVYGLGRFPVTLYKEQWIRLLDHTDEIRSFLKENDQLLKAKQQGK